MTKSSAVSREALSIVAPPDLDAEGRVAAILIA
jgi:hypothetical protein